MNSTKMIEPEIILKEQIKTEIENNSCEVTTKNKNESEKQELSCNERDPHRNEQMFPIADFDEMLSDIQYYDDSKNEDNNTDSEDCEKDKPKNIHSMNNILSHIAERMCTNFENITSTDSAINYTTKKNSKTAIKYFLDYFPEKIFEQLTEYTNQNSLKKYQKEIQQKQQLKENNINLNEKFTLTNAFEIQDFIGIHIIMSLLQYPQFAMYWSPLFYVKSIADRMSQERFLQLREHVRFVNEKPQTSSASEVRDHLWKIRPIFNRFLIKCQNLGLESITTDNNGKSGCLSQNTIPFLTRLITTELNSQGKTLKTFFTFVKLALKNSWLEYKKDAEKICNKFEIMDLLEFNLSTIELLFKSHNELRKRNRSDSSSPTAPFILRALLDNSNEQLGNPAKKQRLSLNRPADSVRYDGQEHWPLMDNKPQRCKMESCDKKASVKCEKCNLHLCMSSNRNCFKLFHTK